MTLVKRDCWVSIQRSICVQLWYMSDYLSDQLAVHSVFHCLRLDNLHQLQLSSEYCSRLATRFRDTHNWHIMCFPIYDLTYTVSPKVDHQLMATTNISEICCEVITSFVIFAVFYVWWITRPLHWSDKLMISFYNYTYIILLDPWFYYHCHITTTS